jgi:hypothetical protein
MAKIQYLPLNLPAQHYRAIGEVTARWARLEFILQMLIWRAMDIDNKAGRVLTLKSAAPKLLDMTRKLEYRWIGDRQTVAALRVFAKDAEALYAERNALVHGIWGRFKGRPKPLTLHRMDGKTGKVLPTGDELTPNAMLATAGKIHQLNRRADALLSTVTAYRKELERKEVKAKQFDRRIQQGIRKRTR